MRSEKIEVGMYRETHPWCKESMLDHISASPYPHKEKILAYLKNGENEYACPGGYKKDVFTRESLPYIDAASTDGKYLWQTVLAHYVDKYNLELDPAFVDHVLAQ